MNFLSAILILHAPPTLQISITNLGNSTKSKYWVEEDNNLFGFMKTSLGWWRGEVFYFMTQWQHNIQPLSFLC